MAKIKTQHAGFSLVEVIVVVAVMAVLAGLSAPAFVNFLNLQREQQEAQEMLEIKEAMRAFVLRFNRLPDEDPLNNGFCNAGTNTWAECLASVSNLSADEIRTDTWDKPRVYVHYEDNSVVLLDTTVDMHYATIFSRGVDNTAEAAANIPVELSSDNLNFAFRPSNHGDWWSNQSGPIDRFLNLTPAGDDMMVKFTDNNIKMERYETTLERMRSITNALQSYADARYNEMVVAGTPTNTCYIGGSTSTEDIDEMRYFPKARHTSPADNACYAANVYNEMTTYGFNANQVENQTSQQQRRRDEMILLMRMLGLPDSTCCNALERVNIGSDWVEPGLFYYSNARLTLGGGGCSGSRPDGRTTGQTYFLPARVTSIAYPCP